MYGTKWLWLLIRKSAAVLSVGCVLQLLTGKGALGQLSLETNLPQPLVNALVGGIVIFNLVTALNPAGTTFSEENQQDVRKRPAGPVQKPSKIDATKPRVCTSPN
jgi:hypothetical protein